MDIHYMYTYNLDISLHQKRKLKSKSISRKVNESMVDSSSSVEASSITYKAHNQCFTQDEQGESIIFNFSQQNQEELKHLWMAIVNDGTHQSKLPPVGTDVIVLHTNSRANSRADSSSRANSFLSTGNVFAD